MRFAEVLKLATWPQIEASLRRDYCEDKDDPNAHDEFVLAHHHAYARLLELDPEADDTVIDIVSFDEEGEGAENFDVSGIKPGSKDSWALDFVRWERWLGMELSRSTLDRFSPSEVTAHCLWEMTFHGYEQEEIAETDALVRGRVGELKEALRRGADSKFINAEDIFREEFGQGPK